MKAFCVRKLLSDILFKPVWGRMKNMSDFLTGISHMELFSIESGHFLNRAALCQLVLFPEWLGYFECHHTLNNESLQLAQANSQCDPSSQLFTS